MDKISVSSDDIEFFTERLKFLWEQYLKIIQVTLLLAGATIATAINIVFSLKSEAENSVPNSEIDSLGFAFAAIIAAGLSGMITLGWRFAAQIIMERQIYGDEEKARQFFRITNTYQPWALKQGGLRNMQIFFECCKYLAGPILLLSWVLLILFTLKNVP